METVYMRLHQSNSIIFFANYLKTIPTRTLALNSFLYLNISPNNMRNNKMGQQYGHPVGHFLYHIDLKALSEKRFFNDPS
jgi:hypothetical protein